MVAFQVQAEPPKFPMLLFSNAVSAGKTADFSWTSHPPNKMPNFCHKQITHGVLVIEQRRRAGDGVIKPSKVTVPGLKNVENHGERNEPN